MFRLPDIIKIRNKQKLKQHVTLQKKKLTSTSYQAPTPGTPWLTTTTTPTPTRPSQPCSATGTTRWPWTSTRSGAGAWSPVTTRSGEFPWSTRSGGWYRRGTRSCGGTTTCTRCFSLRHSPIWRVTSAKRMRTTS